MKLQRAYGLMFGFLASSFMLYAAEAPKPAIPSKAAEEVFMVQPNKSMVKWVGRKKLINSEHHGVVQVKGGTVTMKSGEPTSAEFEVDMTTIEDKDLIKAEDNAKLVGHLKSPDFFGVTDFPVAKLNLTTFKKAGEKYEATGTLTIKKATHPVTLTANVKRDGKAFTATTKFAFDRTMFDVRFGSDKFFEKLGDKVIADEVNLDVAIVAEAK